MHQQDHFRQIERPHIAVHDQGQRAIQAFSRQALDETLACLGRMEEANLDVMRIVAAVVRDHERGTQAEPAHV
jgi:hypothetical protein